LGAEQFLSQNIIQSLQTICLVPSLGYPTVGGRWARPRNAHRWWLDMMTTYKGSFTIHMRSYSGRSKCARERDCRDALGHTNWISVRRVRGVQVGAGTPFPPPSSLSAGDDIRCIRCRGGRRTCRRSGLAALQGDRDQGHGILPAQLRERSHEFDLSDVIIPKASGKGAAELNCRARCDLQRRVLTQHETLLINRICSYTRMFLLINVFSL
jgi:hypothetical protein